MKFDIFTQDPFTAVCRVTPCSVVGGHQRYRLPCSLVYGHQRYRSPCTLVGAHQRYRSPCSLVGGHQHYRSPCSLVYGHQRYRSQCNLVGGYQRHLLVSDPWTTQRSWRTGLLRTQGVKSGVFNFVCSPIRYCYRCASDSLLAFRLTFPSQCLQDDLHKETRLPELHR